jgi:hypothetical protein
MNKSKLKIMATSLALSAASSGAWGANAVVNVDHGCCIWGNAGKLVGSPDGSFIPLGIPFISGSTWAFGPGSTPIAIVRLVEADKDGEGNMTSLVGSPSATRRERGYYVFSRFPADVQTVLQGTDDVQVYALVQHIEAQDLSFRTEMAIHPDFHSKGNYDGWEFGIFGPSHVNPGYVAPIVDCQPVTKLKQNMHSIGNIEFDNSKFCDIFNCPSLKIASKSDLEGKHHLSFVSVFRKKGGKKAFVTLHWIILDKGIADRMRQQICLADLNIKYKGYYGAGGEGNFSKIYNTNVIGRANLAALCRDLGVAAPMDGDDADALNRKWQAVFNQREGPVADLTKPGIGLSAFINFCFSFLKIGGDYQDHGRTFWGICNA